MIVRPDHSCYHTAGGYDKSGPPVFRIDEMSSLIPTRGIGIGSHLIDCCREWHDSGAPGSLKVHRAPSASS